MSRRSGPTIEPIGIVHTPYTSRYLAPRQPGMADVPVAGTIELFPGKNFEQALEDLRGFDYVWVLFWFNRNKGWKPKVLPPTPDRIKRGLFATRSPYRPNPIGLSLCRVLDVSGRKIRIEGPDMLDGTPVLDLKPYIPSVEAHPKAAAGWIDGMKSSVRSQFRVRSSAAFALAMKQLEPDERQRLSEYVNTTLARDPYPHSYRRIKQLAEGEFELSMRTWRVVYRLRGSVVILLRLHDVREHPSSGVRPPASKRDKKKL